MHSFESIVDALWDSLMSRHAKKVRGVRKHAPAVATKPAFREWLREQSEDGRGQVWICAYSRERLTYQQKSEFQKVDVNSCLSIDHYVAMERGGLTELSNLRVCSRRMNNMKGSMSPEGWRSLQRLLADMGDIGKPDAGDTGDLKYLIKQLCAQQTFVKHQRSNQKAQKAAVWAGTGRGW